MKNACARGDRNERRTRSASRWATLGSAATIAAGAALWCDDASAANTLGVALDYAKGLDEPGVDPGAGVELYFGPRMDLAVVNLTTELRAGFHDFGGDFNPAIYRLSAGGRLAVGVIVQPSISAHIGVGHLRYDTGIAPLTDEREGRTNVAGDIGLGLDFTLIPLLDLGVHGSYNVLAGGSDSDAFNWLQLGVHATFVFGS
jgi:hypothetical protein